MTHKTFSHLSPCKQIEQLLLMVRRKRKKGVYTKDAWDWMFDTCEKIRIYRFQENNQQDEKNVGIRKEQYIKKAWPLDLSKFKLINDIKFFLGSKSCMNAFLTWIVLELT